MLQHWTRNLFIVGIAPAVIVIGLGTLRAAPSKTATAEQAKWMQKMFMAEEARPVGQPLPSNVTAIDQNGKTIRLRDVMHGPAIVIKTESGCPPCEQLLTFLRQRGPAYAKTHHVQFIILNTASPDDPAGAKFPRDLPAPIVTLHNSDMMLSGFLGGGFYPYLFFFDKDSVLVGRRIDVRTPVEATFAFPAPPRGGH